MVQNLCVNGIGGLNQGFSILISGQLVPEIIQKQSLYMTEILLITKEVFFSKS